MDRPSIDVGMAGDLKFTFSPISFDFEVTRVVDEHPGAEPGPRWVRKISGLITAKSEVDQPIAGVPALATVICEETPGGPRATTLVSIVINPKEELT